MKYWCFFITIIFTLISSSALQAQERKVVVGVGKVQISDDMSPAVARERALQEARLDALRKAGVAEYVSESSALFQESDQTKTDQLFSSIINVETRGEIAEYKVSHEEKKTEYGYWFQEVVIEAVVYLHTEKPDPSFRAEVKGVREIYYLNDNLTFEVYPSQDAYLRVFILNALHADQLFPNSWEKQHRITAGKSHSFPISGNVDYILETEKQKEVNYIFFLFSKRDFAPPQDNSLNAFWRYIANIPVSEKHVQVESVLIRKP